MRVTPGGAVRLLIPMVTEVSEILAVRRVIDELTAELEFRGRITLGAMIETPAAALTASALLREVDFLSIGSNDLTQYTLAMDRGHTQLARRTDALHPAVLQLMAAAASAAKAAGKLVAVCGGVAADHTAVPILLGFGVRELSVVPAAIPELKGRIRSLRMAECEKLAQRCLGLGSAAEVRGMVERFDGRRRSGPMNFRFTGFQQLGRALMLPIAVLPIAGLLLRLGQPDLLDWPAMFAAGNVVFENLGLLFAVGVGVGLARKITVRRDLQHWSAT